jgi:hypothetical protein
MRLVAKYGRAEYALSSKKIYASRKEHTWVVYDNVTEMVRLAFVKSSPY